jgi:hypothetical protein
MGQNVTCTLETSGCTTSATLTSTPVNDPPFTGTFIVASDGATQLAIAGDPLVPGHLSSDANLLVLNQANQNLISLVLGVKQGTGMSQASLNGTYRFARIGRLLGTQNASIVQSHLVGTAEFNGAGVVTIFSTDTTQTREEKKCVDTVPLFCGFTIEKRANTTSATEIYNVLPTGLVMIGTDVTGWASPDGSVVVFTSQTNNAPIGGGNGNGSERGIGIMFK